MNSKLFLMFLLLTISVCAQSDTDKSFSVKGFVVDDTLKTPLPGATIVAVDSTMRVVAEAVSDTDGRFRLSGLPSRVRINVFLLGYKLTYFVFPKFHKKQVDMSIRLYTMNFHIQEAVLKGEKPLVEYFVDKQVVHVDKLPGFERYDVLFRMSVSGFFFRAYPKEEKIQMYGQDAKILIDGKALTNAFDLADNMTAEAVDRVEVMSVPFAKQQAEGGSWIINIIPKHSLGDD